MFTTTGSQQLVPAPEDHNEDLLTQISQTVDQLEELDQNIQTQEDALKQLKEQRRRVATEVLPAMLTEAQQSELTTMSGCKVTLKHVVKATFPKDHADRSSAIAWLDGNGHGSIIKTKLVANYARDEREALAQVEQMLAEQGVDAAVDETVHPQTLTKFVKEMAASGHAVPKELFGVYEYDEVKVKH